MAVHALSENFKAFFGRINPSPSWVRKASSEYNTIKGLIEAPSGLAAALSPTCFLQGSYDRDTAIYSIDDVDVVALCCLWQPGFGPGTRWSRDQIFDTVAAPLLSDGRYRDKVRYGRSSMCIKVDLGTKVEILPVVYRGGNNDPNVEPFRLYRPEHQQWEDGYARYHQAALTAKNASTGGNFIPMVKVMKHLRTQASLDAVSFHMECLLYSLPDSVFVGGPADHIVSVLACISAYSPSAWYSSGVTPPWEPTRRIFSEEEWASADWDRSHRALTEWARMAEAAARARDRGVAVQTWKKLLGDTFFTR